MTFLDEVRAAVRASEYSGYRISKTLGIAESTISRFLAGGGISATHLDVLAEYLDLHVARGRQRKRR